MLRGPEFSTDLFELNDPAGKAATDQEITACVLTREVEKGGAIINGKRQENGLEELELVFVDMILAKEGQEEKKYSNKMSSTLIRAHLSEK